MARPFFILAALGAGLLFIRSQEAEVPALPVQASNSLVELPTLTEEPAEILPTSTSSTVDWSPTASVRAASPLAIAEDPVEPPDRSAIERLVIPDLKVDAQVVLKPRKGNTWDISGLRADLAWLEGTAHPASSGNTVLAGHIMVRTLGKGPFRYLDRLKKGAILLLYTGHSLYVYQVREQRLVRETEGEVTFNTNQPQLTLITCSNWDTVSESYQRRRVVQANLVKVEPIRGSSPLNLDEDR